MPESVTEETDRTYWQFLFLLESTRAAGQHEFIVRLPFPFYGSYHNDERAYTFRHVLYPIFYSHGTDQWTRWTFLFFFSGDDTYHQDTGQDNDLMLGPLLFWGRGDSQTERYFTFFPFFGSWRNKLSWSEINFILFPLYVDWTYREYRAHALIWPLIMWGSGPARSDLRIFPFYSHKIHYGRYARRSILWPFFQWGYEDLNKKEPRGYLYFWPLYSRKWSRDGNLSVHGLLPLFIMPFVSWGSDKKTNSFNFNALWFLYQYEYNDSPMIRKNIIFPFYGYYRFAFKEATFYGPFYVNLQTHSYIFESKTDIVGAIVPLYWKTERFYLQDWKRTLYLKIWPLFQYIRDDRGNREFRSLVLWPARSDNFERFWGPIYSLLEYREFANGDRYFSVMLRIFSRYWNARENHLFILGFEYHNTPRYWSWEFLGGLFGFRHRRTRLATLDTAALPSENTIRLFWLDL